MIAAIAGLLRGGADFFDAVQAAYDERRKGFAEREAGDFLDVEDLDLVRSSELQSPVPPGYPKLVRDAIDAYFEMFAEVTGVQLIEDSARVEGTRRAHTAGEVSAETPDAAPSPAGPGLLAEIRDAVFQVRVIADEWLKQIGDRAINRALSRDFGLTYDQALDAAAEALAESEAEYEVYEPVADDEEPMQVGLEELAAHITAIRRCCSPSRWAADVTVSDEIARDLLADFHITRKK